MSVASVTELRSVQNKSKIPLNYNELYEIFLRKIKPWQVTMADIPIFDRIFRS